MIKNDAIMNNIIIINTVINNDAQTRLNKE